MSWLSSWVYKHDKNNGIRPFIKPFIQITNKKILVITKVGISDNELAFCNYIKSSGFINQNIDIYRNTIQDESNYPKFIENKWRQGYNVFIGTEGSTLLSSIFDFLILHQNDIIYFNVNSTVTFDNLPPNLIRTSLTDKDAIKYCFDNIYTNYNSMFNKTLGTTSGLTPLDETNTMPFKTIVYIYEEDLYTTSFLNDMVTYLMNSPKFYTNDDNSGNDIEFIPIKLDPNMPLYDPSLNDNPNYLAHYYLTYNTIVGNEANGTNPLIILNSSNPVSILSKFNNELYYNNFFILTDPFGNVSYQTMYQFKYAYLFIANNSEIGYKLIGNIGIKDVTSLQTLNIYNVCSLIGPLFNKYIQFGNNNNIQFNSSNFITILNNHKYIVDGLWFDKYIVCEAVYHSDDNTFKHKPSVTHHRWNPDTTSYADNVFDYNDLANTTLPKYNYSSNLSYTLSNKKTNELTGKYDVLLDDSDYEKFFNVYIKYGTYDLSRIDFQKYYTFNNINKIIDLGIKINMNISQNVSDIIYNDQSSTTYDIPVVIPLIIRTKNIRSQDVTNSNRKKLQNDLFIIPSQTITLNDCLESFILVYYNLGNTYKAYSKSSALFNLTIFNQNDLIFEHNQPVWVYVTMTWNVIKTVSIGEEVYIRDPTDPDSITVDASGNSILHYVRSIVNDDTVTISTTNSGNGTITKLKKELLFVNDLPKP